VKALRKSAVAVHHQFMRKRSHRLTADWLDAWIIDIRTDAGSGETTEKSRKRLTDTLVPPVLRSYFASCDQDFRIVRDSNGKPVCPEIDLSFNLAYSDSLAVVAVGLRDKLGLDVERIETEDVDLDSLVHEHFCTIEARTYFNAAPSKRAQIFYHVWTQKEAVSKAIGLGIRQSLQDVAVESNPEKGSRLIALDGQPGDGWTLRNLNVREDHVAVVAAFGPSFLIQARGLDIEADELLFA
jgi:phosphopantetheine--protein transferase-like protein